MGSVKAMKKKSKLNIIKEIVIKSYKRLTKRIRVMRKLLEKE